MSYASGSARRRSKSGFKSLAVATLFSISSIGASFSAFAQSPTSADLKPPGDIGSAIRFKVEKYVLPNGLTILLHEDHTVPLVSYQTWFRVGSKNEQPGLTGLAHLFEHMMFRGA